MKYDPTEAWLGTLITLDVTAWFVWLAALAVTRRAFALAPRAASPRIDVTNSG